MPGILDRRNFLKSVAATAFAVRLQADTPPPSRWALLSDTHCPEDPNDGLRGSKPHEIIPKVAAEVVDFKAEFCSITGDLAKFTGNAGDYPALHRLLQPVLDKMPVGICMGNHDNRQNFQKAFPDLPGRVSKVQRKLVTTVEWNGLRAVFLDSLVDTTVVLGQLGTAQRQWLADYIRADSRPVLLFQHHDFRDNDGALVDSSKLLELVSPLKQVKAIFYGHSHEYHVDTHDGIHLVNVPSTTFAFRPQDPTGWIEMRLSSKGADLLLKANGGNMELQGTKARLDWR